MGRLKLPNEYRENSRKRLTTYRDRMKGLKKKAGELSILCGVDVLFASFSPELNTIQCWPEDYSEFRRIAERYSHYCPPSMAKKMKKKDNVNGCVPCASTPSIQEELASMDKKLIEVRERLRLLENLPLQLGTACPPPPVALPLQLETACPPPPVALPLQLETACPPPPVALDDENLPLLFTTEPPVNIVSSISSAATLAVDDVVDDAYSMRERLRLLEAENL